VHLLPSIEAISNLEKGLIGRFVASKRLELDGLETDTEIGVRRRCKADGGNLKGECGCVVGFFHDGGVCVKALDGQEDENGREQNRYVTER
jgi:hypothetical protein